MATQELKLVNVQFAIFEDTVVGVAFPDETYVDITQAANWLAQGVQALATIPPTPNDILN